MALKGLQFFQRFSLDEFLADKQLVFVKAIPWTEGEDQRGSKVILQILEDRTHYGKPHINNFGEQLAVKVKGVSPDAFGDLSPLRTEVLVKDIEHAVLYGEYKNQLSIIASVAAQNS